MNAKIVFTMICTGLLCSCCGALTDPTYLEGETPTEEDTLLVLTEEPPLVSKARTALREFYALLNQAKYDQAAELYGGSQELLLGYNPFLDEKDTAELLQAACEFNGFMCLELLSASLSEVRNQFELVFEVEFANSDGSLFVLGPCCGENEETMSSKSSFTVHVHCSSEDSCLVIDLPPYVP
jgi:hypothetical protein